MLYFRSGFESGDTTGFTSASGSVQSSVKKNGTYAGQNEDNENFLKTLSTGLSTIVVGGWFRWSADLGNLWFVILGEGATTTQFELRTNSSGKLVMHIPSYPGTSYTGTHTLAKDTWYYIEVKFVLHASAGSFEVRVGGETDSSASGIDTKGGTDTSVTTIKWQGINAAGNCYVDDCFIADFWQLNDYGIKISKSGFDVLTTGDENLVFTSKYKTFKVILTGTVTFTNLANGATSSQDVSHTLGYNPGALCFYNIDSKRFLTNMFSSDDNLNCRVQVWSTDNDTLRIEASNSSGSTQTIVVRYYIFADPGE